MRSGIGPAGQLNVLNLPVVQDLPGVGENLIDHPLLALHFSASAGLSDVPGSQAMLTLTSPHSRTGPDLQIFPWSISPAERGESPEFEIFVSVVKPLSRGSLRLRSSDPAAAPLIDPGFFTHPGDMPRMVYATRLARQLAKTPALSGVALHELFPGPQVTDADADLEAAIRLKAGTYYHPVGTCHMGPAAEAGAVVDARGSVHGVEGLSVVDASIMPTIPAANTNLPTLMLAERCSAWLAASSKPTS
jgi:choline dehydrogenase